MNGQDKEIEQTAKMQNLLGVIANESRAMCEKLSGKTCATIIVCVDEGHVEWMTQLPSKLALEALNRVAEQLKEQSKRKFLVLPASGMEN